MLRSSAGTPATRPDRLWVISCCAVALLYLVLASASAFTLRPWCDEGWFSSPARNLIERGYMGTSALDPTSTFRSVNLDQIDRYTYWIMPLYILVQAAWYEITGVSLASMRSLSILWGGVALAAWCGIVRILTGDRWTAWGAAALLALDFQFLWSSSAGRMDIMAEALAASGLFFYLYHRERNLPLAMLGGHSLVAAACFTHPLMVIGWAGLMVLTLMLDAHRVRWFYWPLGAIPYFVGAGGWWLYIRQAPEVFQRQFGGNASDRWSAFSSPLQAIWLELTERYLQHFGIAAYSPLASRIKLLILVVYAGGVCACLLTPGLRRKKEVRLLLTLALLYGVLLMVLDSLRQLFYLVHILPLFAALTAIALREHIPGRGKLRSLAWTAVAVLVAVQLLVTFSRSRTDAYHGGFLAAAQALQERLRQHPSQMVMASAEWLFVPGVDGLLVDDWRLGYRSGKQPGFIVMDENRYQEWTSHLEQQDPGNYQYIRRLLEQQYKVIYDHRGYRIYERLPRS